MLKMMSIILTAGMLTFVPMTDSSSRPIDTSKANESVIMSIGLIGNHMLRIDAGSSAVLLTAKTSGNDIMSEIGIKNIQIQHSSDGINWTTEKTISKYTVEDTTIYSTTSKSISVNGGYYYRIILDHYAKEDTWWFPDEEYINSTSNTVWIS